MHKTLRLGEAQPIAIFCEIVPGGSIARPELILAVKECDDEAWFEKYSLHVSLYILYSRRNGNIAQKTIAFSYSPTTQTPPNSASILYRGVLSDTKFSNHFSTSALYTSRA
jgi:hypothetical protein